MRSLSSNQEPAKRSMRHFAWMVALVLAVLARFLTGPEQVYLAFAAAGVFSIGTVLPRLFRLPYKLLCMPILRLAKWAFAPVMKIDKVISNRQKQDTTTSSSRF
jgi:hypothetical protein